MVGNAVPVKLAEAIAKKIMEDLNGMNIKDKATLWQTKSQKIKEAELCPA